MTRTRTTKRNLDNMTDQEQEAYIAESEHLLDALDPTAIAAADHLGDLRAIRAISDDLDSLGRQLERAVVDAHRSGRSWSQIANALGIAKQSAHARYATLAAVDEALDP
jgi:DNA-directed RNA polymerase specialized sigma24 family protein